MCSIALMVIASAASWVKKIDGAGNCYFPTGSCKFPTEENTGAQNFNFPPKFSQNGGFSTPKFCIFGWKILRQEENFVTFSQQPKI